MNILITGGSGLIGRALIQHLNAERIIVLTRNPAKTANILPDNIEFISTLGDIDFNELDVVINLAGEAIVDKRWSKAQKNTICQSRWKITQKLVEKIQAATNPPHSLISGSAIGFYGRQGALAIDESYQEIHDEFSHKVCQKWEAIAQTAASDKTRVCIIRTGIVLAENGGALQKMLLPFKFGLGGPIASGEQFMSWIHIDDMVAVLLAAVYQTSLTGIINATAPMPVSNQEFSETLSAVLKRPCLFRVPAFVLRALMGESADLVLYGQNVLPSKLLNNNFKFQYPSLEVALKQLLVKP
ncbi:TIGR01777 family protein [Colwellia sp. MB02u-18]|nr:TIGR01777 family protein [Colwellia sp. MB3u-45]MBA6267312.1 TIGR01777 family protein [Colwellia sp. MB3u-43]MBA6319803.1 TIGR01777 family protein [Colwellia sp. MB02u-19]MBA6323818.1 TIGR01777 family protein [Colwellia sp. MB02u-18]MBA6330808.1 TIGR01777 family protein [Colwellia sp. MB02u-12]MBA6345133.1 TIGR01777 family protein [Colwellia sp. MB02u-1]